MRRKKLTRVKVERAKLLRLTPRERCRPGRHFTILPDDRHPHIKISLRIARNNRGMLESMCSQGFYKGIARFRYTSGLVLTLRYEPTFVGPKLYRGGILAHMFLQVKECRRRPVELLAHESGHAAMAWARYRSTDLRAMGSDSYVSRKDSGEELMCYALGDIAYQVNRALHAHGTFRGM